MNWEREVEDRLRKYSYRLEAIDNLKDKLNYINSILTSVKPISIDKDPIKSGGSKQEDILINHIMEKNLLEKNLKYCKMETKEIEKALKILTETELKVVQSLYMSKIKININHICKELGYSKSSIYTISHTATRKLALELYGKLMTE